jgi:hypothetical protein
MKKVIMAFGYLFLALIAILIAGMISLAIQGNRLDKESNAFADAAIQAIVSEWDVGELQKRASPEFNEEADYDEWGRYFTGMRRQLGTLQEYGGAIGEANIAVSLRYGIEITADYAASADFENRAADIQVSLIKHGGRWQILDFVVRPPGQAGQDIPI